MVALVPPAERWPPRRGEVISSACSSVWIERSPAEAEAVGSSPAKRAFARHIRYNAASPIDVAGPFPASPSPLLLRG